MAWGVAGDPSMNLVGRQVVILDVSQGVVHVRLVVPDPVLLEVQPCVVRLGCGHAPDSGEVGRLRLRVGAHGADTHEWFVGVLLRTLP